MPDKVDKTIREIEDEAKHLLEEAKVKARQILEEAKSRSKEFASVDDLSEDTKKERAKIIDAASRKAKTSIEEAEKEAAGLKKYVEPRIEEVVSTIKSHIRRTLDD